MELSIDINFTGRKLVLFESNNSHVDFIVIRDDSFISLINIQDICQLGTCWVHTWHVQKNMCLKEDGDGGNSIGLVGEEKEESDEFTSVVFTSRDTTRWSWITYHLYKKAGILKESL